MIEVQELTKYFGATLAVNDVSFKVDKGEIIGLLGPNGSGKTTIMRVLTGFFPATSGRALIGGLDVAEHSLETRRRVGYLPENMVLYPDLSVDALLEFGARVREIDPRTTRDRIEYSLETCGLKDVRRKLIGKLSKGYRQRVGIAQAILSDPEVLILDEPTVGLDPRQVVEIRDLIRSLAGHSTVLLSTHILPEVNMTCRRVVIIDRANRRAGHARAPDGETAGNRPDDDHGWRSVAGGARGFDGRQVRAAARGSRSKPARPACAHLSRTPAATARKSARRSLLASCSTVESARSQTDGAQSRGSVHAAGHQGGAGLAAPRAKFNVH